MSNSNLEYKEIKRVKKTNDKCPLRIVFFSLFALLTILVLAIFLSIIVRNIIRKDTQEVFLQHENIISVYSLEEIPDYNGFPYVVLNNNIPLFDKEDSLNGSFEIYSELDDLGRCGTAYACLGRELMPTEERGEIGMIKPTGWHTTKYPDLIEDLYLYNRCHLIAFSLSGENANEKNLITGTRYFNISGMLPFETDVRDYIYETDNHVLYRVTPIYDEDNLLAQGVIMEAYSIEDNGKGICFNVFIYNIQPGIIIDYKTGESWIEE